MNKAAGMNRIRIILIENHTLHEMLIGIVLSNFFLALIGVILSEDKMKALIGVCCGMVIACIYVIYMAVSIDDALCLDEKGAAASMRKHMLIRYALVFVLAGCVCYFQIGSPVLCILGILTVKLGAYMQPGIHKIIKWR